MLVVACALLYFSPFSFAAKALSANVEPDECKQIAILSRNDSGNSLLDSRARSFENLLSAQVSNFGLAAIDRNLVLETLDKNVPENGDAQKNPASSNKIYESILFGASGLRVMELIGADYVLSTSFSSLTTTRKKFSGYGIATENLIFKLRVAYTLRSANTGAGTVGGVAEVSQTLRSTGNLEIETDGILEDLLTEAAEKISQDLDFKKRNKKIAQTSSQQVPIQFVCMIEAMSLPQIIENEDGKFVLGTEVIPATLSLVNIEIDGVLHSIDVGDGTPVELSRGLHTLKIVQKDVEPLERAINITGKPGQTIALSLLLTEAARKRWKDDMLFVEGMIERAKKSKRKDKLTTAEVDRIRGFAEMLRNSGFRVDIQKILQEQ